MKGKSLVSITDYSKDDILRVLSAAKEFEKNPNQQILQGKVVATLFFEPSTRTRLSFETAANRLGARVIGEGAALELVDVFLNTEFEGERHQRRVDLITEIENNQ